MILYEGRLVLYSNNFQLLFYIWVFIYTVYKTYSSIFIMYRIAFVIKSINIYSYILEIQTEIDTHHSKMRLWYKRNMVKYPF